MNARQGRARWRSHGWLLGATLAPLTALAQEVASTDGLQLARLDRIEEVVVTSRRRAENLQQVPVAISALNADELQSTGTYSAYQLPQKVPSTIITGFNPRNASISIRGLGLAAANDGLENSVGTFLDGVFLARPASALFDLIDVERIEVLRGPQGTLFGKNTTAGALNIITQKPAFEPSAKLEISAGDYNYRQYRAAATGPLSETLAGRFTLFSTQRDGFIDHVHTGEDYQDYENYGARAQLLWQPSDALSARLIVDSAHQEQDCCALVLVDYGTVLPNGGTRPNNFLDRSGRANYTPLSADPFAWRTDVDSPAHFKMNQSGVSLELNWAFAAHTLTSISAARQWDWEPHNDADATALAILTRANVASEQEQFSQELRIASSNDGELRYVAGAFLFHQTIDSTQRNSYGADASNWIFGPAVPASVLDGFTSVQHAQPDTDSYAIFAQGDWDFAAHWSLTLGARYTYEEKRGEFQQYGEGGAVLPPALQAIRNNFGATAVAFEDNLYEGALSGLASVNYRWTDDVLIYLSLAHGFKSGGINLVSLPAGAQSLIDPEVADDVELGVKSEWFDRRVIANAVLYWTEVDDYQSVQVDTQRTTSYLANAASVRARGVELELTAVPLDGLQLSTAIGYNEARYRDYENAPCPPEAIGRTVCDLSGKPVQGAPRWTANIGAEYRRDLNEFDAEGYVGANYAYTDDFSSQGSNSIDTIVPGYGVANMRIGVDWVERGIDMSLWVRNLFDKEYFTYLGTTQFNSAAVTGGLGDPRTVGATLRLQF